MIATPSSAMQTERKADGTEDSPNQFELRGKGIYVHYSTSSLAGGPVLTFRSCGLEKSFKGDEIRVTNTEVGKMVSVKLTEVSVERVDWFSFFVPAFKLAAGTKETTFQSAGVSTTFTGFVGPSGANGALAAYDAVDLRGIANVVSFLQPAAR